MVGIHHVLLRKSMEKPLSVGCAIVTGSIIAATVISWLLKTRENQRPKSRKADLHVNGVAGLIGNTPLIRLHSLSEATGCEILAKAEFMNVGGSTKDRIALGIIEDAEVRGLIQPNCGCTIFEGTVGSTGISLAVIARAKGYLCHIVMPDDQAQEKYAIIEALGAFVEKVRPVSIVDTNHYVNIARRRAEEMNLAADATSSAARGFFCDQFENMANFKTHLRVTGPEIFADVNGHLDAFVMGAGTGGTLGGVAHFLKPLLPDLKIVLADPDGSGLFNKVKHNVMYTPEQAEGKRRRHQVDTIVEGIGNNRITSILRLVLDGCVDDAVRVSDQDAVEMSRYLMREEGLFVGSSSAVHCVAVCRVAKQLGPGHTLLTLLCDHGSRHLTKFWSPTYIQEAGLTPTCTSLSFI
ncbi:hypothetical protein BASA50_006557 [Batrachochytrium salamandrivorans]|uniref:Tryptophan synthase beta chain-like PALP domain-containing protein n=1 Tax=Batrachochytrium salamandrivorans TaxID=1357716 RepID=A0ABQ8FA78_9FUNG|nr:hypothetical protein BASA62_009203 [Batrachochytrium salamandrivorans]KAH6577211.1 hypothetical protein BASA60_004146 [Batrachochytrium salamandrivorans]KAH6582900.1 hypothetical protein BASA61_008312 [Batrachochytrium salamandrivorans]KAH6594608.1 hypothetical protein BASA50_006557 [Batrachochytrium salamandrivorans]KAH9252500.1 hypothetical protein BASA81_009543 [Batrachochytrium salamandrivorans]